MSKENVQVVRDALEAWNLEDQDAALELFSTDVELDASDRVLNPDSYRGIDGLLRFRREIADIWDRFQLDIEEVFESDDMVVIFVRSTGEGRASGVEVDFRSAW